MVKKITIIDNFEKPVYIETIGNYNNLPEPFEESTIELFYKMLFTYPPAFMEHRQIIMNKIPYSTKIFYFSHEAFALVRIDDSIKVFKIGCQHDYKVIRSMQCYREYECQKCGQKYAVDSSD